MFETGLTAGLGTGAVSDGEYLPIVIDGVAVEVTGVRNRIVFTMDQSRLAAAAD